MGKFGSSLAGFLQKATGGGAIVISEIGDSGEVIAQVANNLSGVIVHNIEEKKYLVSSRYCDLIKFYVSQVEPVLFGSFVFKYFTYLVKKIFTIYKEDAIIHGLIVH